MKTRASVLFAHCIVLALPTPAQHPLKLLITADLQYGVDAAGLHMQPVFADMVDCTRVSIVDDRHGSRHRGTRHQVRHHLGYRAYELHAWRRNKLST